MAEEKSGRTLDKNASRGEKIANFFRYLPRRIVQPFKNMWRELKKVTWPSRQDLISYTLIVIGFMVFMGLVIGLLDMGASKLIALMVG